MIIQGVCLNYKKDMFDGTVHTANDTYKIALYSASADLSPETDKYSKADEILGKGYDPGGKILSGYSVKIEDTQAVLKFNNAAWNNASIRAAGFLIYNASKNNKAVFVGSFGGDVVSTNDTFIIEIPAEGLVRL